MALNIQPVNFSAKFVPLSPDAIDVTRVVANRLFKAFYGEDKVCAFSSGRLLAPLDSRLGWVDVSEDLLNTTSGLNSASCLLSNFAIVKAVKTQTLGVLGMLFFCPLFDKIVPRVSNAYDLRIPKYTVLFYTQQGVTSLAGVTKIYG